MADIDGWLPLIALVVAAVALFTGKEAAKDSPPKKSTKLAIIGVGIVGLLIIWFFLKSANQTWADIASAKGGFILGILGAICAEWCAQWGKPARCLPIAFAAFALSFAHFFGQLAPLGFVFGAAATAWVLSMRAEAGFAARTAVAAGGIVACDALGALQAAPVANMGIWLAMTACVASFFVFPYERKEDVRIKAAGLVVFSALFCMGGFFVFRKASLDESFTYVFSVSVLISLIVLWLSQPEESITRTVLGAILWFGIASVFYGYGRGFGMSVALMAGLCTTLMADRPRALLCLGPLASIVLLHLFTALHPDLSRSFDIGQNYALMGVLLGALTPILAGEWLRSEAVSGKRAWVAAVLWILLLAAAPLPVSIAFSEKGILGYLVGLGLAPVLEAARKRSLDTLYISIGLGASMVLLYNWVHPYADLGRDAKIHALIWVVSAMAVAIAGVLFTSGSAKSGDAP
jgi:hypothetical protein